MKKISDNIWLAQWLFLQNNCFFDGAAVSSRRRGSSAEIVRSFSFCVYF